MYGQAAQVTNGWDDAAKVSSGGYPMQATDTPQLPLLDDVRQQIETAIKNLHELTEQVRQFADSSLGNSQIGHTGPIGDPKEANGRGEQIRQRLGYLSSSIGTLRMEINRLGAI